MNLLTSDGRRLAAGWLAVGPSTALSGFWAIWEVSRTSTRAGDPNEGRATYRVMPDKEAPLWHPYTEVIYWWTAIEAGDGRAYRIGYNGYVLPV